MSIVTSAKFAIWSLRDDRRMVNHPAEAAPRERGLNEVAASIAARFTGHNLSQGLESVAMQRKN